MHDHTHHHGHDHAPASDRGLVVAVVINVGLSVAQIIGGIAAASMALIADGVHNLSDAVSLVMAFGARKLARRPATATFSFGFGRAEIVAALVNFVTLIVVAIWLAAEAVGRLMDPPPVAGGMVMALAGLALAIDLATAMLTFRLSKGSVNIRAAFLHNLTDAGASLAVLAGGALIWGFGWNWADPAITILISGLILWHVAGDLPEIWRILMLGAPEHVSLATLRDRVHAVEGVEGSHHLHLWQIDEHRAAVQGHLVLAPGAEAATVLRAVKAALAEDFDLTHATFETETTAGGCAGGGFEAGRQSQAEHISMGHRHDVR